MNFGKQDVFQNGERFHGYVIERLLGNGGLGAVYLVRHEMLDTRFALKVLFPEVARENDSYVKRFLREAKIATRIRHPNLVAVHDCGYDEARGLYYLVMDYVNGGDLRQAIAFAGRFEPDRAVEVAMQVASALEAAQTLTGGHRDIKPENIMIQPDGLVKLVDLGIAKSEDVKDSLNTRTENVFGTPAYVAPEQALDAAAVDTRADIYSLGVVLFEMIAGKPPFEGPNAPQILAQTLSEDPFPDIRDYNPNVPPMLAALIRRMCVKERDRRISGPTALLREFEKLGYRMERPASTEIRYSKDVENAPTHLSVKSVLNRLPKDGAASEALSFETDDDEIRQFVTRLKRRRLMRKVSVALTAAAAVIATLVSIWLVS
ncbi:MAG: serine/threonine protein kinase [Kiritimatiellae bacterium]|nr:serine/threonine protein kinase [Kiritimatiellia bacterium]